MATRHDVHAVELPAGTVVLNIDSYVTHFDDVTEFGKFVDALQQLSGELWTEHGARRKP